MLLVMSNGGYLAPPDENPEGEELWNETWKRINRFLPNFFAELFPEEAGKPPRNKEKTVPVVQGDAEKENAKDADGYGKAEEKTEVESEKKEG